MYFRRLNIEYVLYLIILFIAFHNTSISQVVFVPVDDGIYEYLEKLYAENVVKYDDATKPLSRKYIAKKLVEASEKKSLLTDIEMKELEYYKNEYFYEIERLNNEINQQRVEYLSFDEHDRFRFLTYCDSTFSIFLDPVLSYDITERRKNNLVDRKNGFKLYGNISNYIAFQIRYLDNLEVGNFIDFSRQFSQKTGLSFDYKEINRFSYDDVCAALTLSWKWGDFSLEKDYLKWGNGKNGQIIISDKAPSFPMICLNSYPVDWLYFTYILGYLNSGVIDSTTIRKNISKEREHYSLIEKYLVAHMLTLKPFSTLSISLGESVIFSDRFEPIYLIPFIPFRIADHYLNYVNETAGNAQIFLDLSWVIPKVKSKLYGTLFIDEYSVSNVLDHTDLPAAVAYTIGYQIIDPLINDLCLNSEYTRINPFVYFHADDAQGYSNYGYQMGHWIGSNGDQIYLSMTKSFMRGLKLNTYWEYIRKGQKESHKEPRYQSWQTFLYGLRTNYTYFGIGLHYEIIHTLFAKLDYKYSRIESQQKDLLYKTEKYNDFTIGLSYGL